MCILERNTRSITVRMSPKRWERLMVLERQAKELEKIARAAAMPAVQIDPDFKSKPTYTVDEFIDTLAKDLGQHYGVGDIRNVR